jgi:hypothetical protein
MGSPADEPGRNKNEGPQHRVRVNSFWMARTELRADLIDLWVFESAYAQRLAAGQKVDDPLSPQALRAATRFPSPTFALPLYFINFHPDIRSCRPCRRGLLSPLACSADLPS